MKYVLTVNGDEVRTGEADNSERFFEQWLSDVGGDKVNKKDDIMVRDSLFGRRDFHKFGSVAVADAVRKEVDRRLAEGEKFNGEPTDDGYVFRIPNIYGMFIMLWSYSENARNYTDVFCYTKDKDFLFHQVFAL